MRVAHVASDDERFTCIHVQMRMLKYVAFFWGGTLKKRKEFIKFQCDINGN